MIFRHIISDRSGLVFGSLEQDLDVLQVANRSLGIDVELAERLDVVAEIFDADRPRGLPRKDIDDAAADGELSARRDLADAFVIGAHERFDRALEWRFFPASQAEDRGVQRRRIRRGLVERRAGGDDEVRTFLALKAVEQREPFRRDLRIRQDIFDGGELGFRKEERVGLPVQQTFVKQFLGSDTRAKDPERFPDFFGDCRDEKCLGGLSDVGKGDRAHSSSDLAQFLRDRVGLRDDGGKGIARRFFHRQCFAGTARTSNGLRLSPSCSCSRSGARRRITSAVRRLPRQRGDAERDRRRLPARGPVRRRSWRIAENRGPRS